MLMVIQIVIVAGTGTNNSISKILTCNRWFADWKTYMTTPTNYSIPILTCIGNHEAGGFKMPRWRIGSYLRYFPHKIDLFDVSPQLRPLNHTHIFGCHSV